MLLYHGYAPDDIRLMPYMRALRLYWQFYQDEAEGLQGRLCKFSEMDKHGKAIHEFLGSDLEPEEFIWKSKSPSPCPLQAAS